MNPKGPPIGAQGNRFVKYKKSMKNIFDYLLNDRRSLNEKPYASFAEWMFRGTDSDNTLSRRFLRWSLQCMVEEISDRKPTNLDFYDFFHGIDQSDPESFFSRISEVGELRCEVSEQLAEYPEGSESVPIRSAFLHSIGTVMEHVADESLFPEEPKRERKSNPYPQEGTLPHPFDGNSEKGFKSFTRLIYALFAIFLTALALFNFLFTR